MDIQIADYVHNSLVNGKGPRDVIFFSGCKHNCKGCHNEAAQDFSFGNKMSVEEIAQKVLKNKPMIDGVTISGGDPFYQYDGLLELCKELKKHDINIWVYTGYEFADIVNKYGCEVCEYIDVLVDGPYFEGLRMRDTLVMDRPSLLKYRGSSNQTFFYFDSEGHIKNIQREYKEEK